MNERVKWIPYCGEAPDPDVWLSRWNLDPVLGAGMMLWAIALWWPSTRPQALSSRLISLRCAWAVAVLLYVSPLCALSSAFFTVRVIHHVVLVLVIAPLLAHGLQPWLSQLRTPLWTSTALAAATFWTWHAPGPYGAALSSVAIYWLMQLTLLFSATAFWIAVQRSGPVSAIAAILATTVQMGLLGALITFAARPLYVPHFASTLSWGVSPLEDQQVAGITMWAPGSMAYLVAALWICWRWLHADRMRATRVEAA